MKKIILIFFLIDLSLMANEISLSEVNSSIIIKEIKVVVKKIITKKNKKGIKLEIDDISVSLLEGDVLPIKNKIILSVSNESVVINW